MIKYPKSKKIMASESDTERFEARPHSHNYYFTTFEIWDKQTHDRIGLIEYHGRDVKHPYFVGWKFKNNRYSGFPNEAGKTKDFDNYEDALEYIQEPWDVESATHPITAATRAKKDISGLADEIIDGLENLLIALRSVPNPEEYYDDNDLDDIQRVIDRLNDISMKWDYDWERNN